MHYFYKTALITCLLLFLSRASYSQLFFNKGYITVPGDTLTGEIRERNNQTIDFRTGPDSSIQEYTPEQISGYFLEGDKQTVSSLTFTEEGQKKAYFMREQIRGYVSLYSLFRPEGRLTHAIRLPSKTVVPLRGNLALLMLTTNLTACKDPSFTRLLNPQNFYGSNSQFERIVKDYNACVSPDQSVKPVKKRFRYEMGLLAGAVQNTWKYAAAEDRFQSYWNPNGPYSSHYTATVGGFFTFAHQKKLSLDIEVFYTGYKGSRVVVVNNPLEPTAKDSRLYTFSERYLALPITARYTLGQGPVRWYIKGGFVLVYETDIQGTYSGSNIVHTTMPLKSGISIGYLAGIGASFQMSQKRNLQVEARIIPHIAVDRATRIATSRSLQLTARLPLLVH
ncbi:hypothetical protein LX87_05138 [Larkinella arboricola]|uniref:Outer membrane protein with beta-barrel domain n=1 Tax=Larkinella arboricola TaxID=643671 RepID=A0A327WLA3_LARAB|nr:hypothetical protein [Larkinella arboricola]RAJ92171.1 hypothetical protein LX87_05138 [Larkinella arboricola]